jgi:hypothetical protein
MRRAARADRNQPEIVAALRGVGATVQPLHTIGKGCPDALIGYRGRNLLFEIKDGLLVPSKQALTSDELKWHEFWHGQVCTVNSIEAAIAALNEVTA